MDASFWLLVAGGAMVAGFVQGLSGFGFSLVVLSIWSWAIEPRLAAPMAVFGALSGQLLAALTVRRGFDKRKLAPFLIGGLLGVPIGGWLLPRIDELMFRALLGGLLALWCPLMLASGRIPHITRGGRWADGLVGMAGGVAGALGGLTGALPTLWCTLRGEAKESQRAIIQNFNLALLAVTFVMYMATGVVTTALLPMFALIAPAMLIPTLLGARLYIGISPLAFRNLVLGLLSASGAALLAGSLPALLARPG